MMYALLTIFSLAPTIIAWHIALFIKYWL
jgi:hypothetical protein